MVRRLAACITAGVWMAALAAGPDKYPITSIIVKGNKYLSAGEIIAASGLKIGELADKARFEQARKQLEATGMLDSIGYQFEPAENGKGYVATFNVDEVAPLYTVEYEGLNASRDDINNYLKSKEVLYNGKLPPTSYIIERYTHYIETYLASIHHAETVVSNVVPSGADSYELVFRNGAPLPSIAEVTFEGNKAVLITDLEHAINDVAYGTPYSQYTFKLLLDNQIKPLYEAKGYLAVKFLNVATEPSKTVKGIVVHLKVDEGPVYKLSGVSLSGVTRGETTDLGKIAKFKIGEVADFDDINEAVDRMKKHLIDDGYIHAETEVMRRMNDAAKTVSLLVKLTKGPQYHYGKLTILGLDLDGEAQIRKLWAGRPDKPYHAEYADYFLAKIKQEGLFDNLGETKAVKKMDDEKHVVDITLDFKGAPMKKDRSKGRGPF